MKLIIADDQTSIHRFLHKMIEWHTLGITEVRSAFTGKEAAEMTESWEADILLIDIRMPEWDGIEALRQIGERLGRKPKVLILSAYDEFAYARDALALGVSQYLLKPIDTVQLKEALQRLTAEIQAECGQALTQELELAALESRRATAALTTPSAAAECFPELQRAFRVFGIHGFAVIAVRSCQENGLAAELFSFLTADHFLILASIDRRDGEGGAIVLLGFREPDVTIDHLTQAWLHGASHSEERHDYPPAVLGISSLTANSDELPNKINESLLALQATFYHSEKMVFTYEEARLSSRRTGWNENENRGNAIDPGILLTLEEHIRRGYDYAALQSGISKLFAHIREQKPEPQKVYEAVYRILLVGSSMFERRQREGGGQQAQLPFGGAEDLLYLKRSFRTLPELEHFLHSMLPRYVGAAFPREASDRGTAPSQVIRTIKCYVDEHFDADLSLQAVSDRFAIDKYRLSREFKAAFDENYWTYVTRVRMERAAAFLRETDWKISTIAERAGYWDESHFSRTFKKVYRVSPKEYRCSNN
ncbi:response regulator transcription factor [Paenibacillus turpanensis]|uniref:response regulator transcription factor n=1 Tax=Paenibacillus turpanensis TaxID=2689078 RepID=UPI001FB5881F|nr:response regulator [Paenibacillus turpanensis]